VSLVEISCVLGWHAIRESNSVHFIVSFYGSINRTMTCPRHKNSNSRPAFSLALVGPPSLLLKREEI
jgi:hypothetical protein